MREISLIFILLIFFVGCGYKTDPIFIKQGEQKSDTR